MAKKGKLFAKNNDEWIEIGGGDENALPKSGGAMTGQLPDVAKGQVHNISYSETAPVGAINGDIWIVAKIKPRTWTINDFDWTSVELDKTWKINPELRQFFIIGDVFNISVLEMFGELTPNDIGLVTTVDDSGVIGTISGTITRGVGRENVMDVTFRKGSNFFRTNNGSYIPIKNP